MKKTGLCTTLLVSALTALLLVGPTSAFRLVNAAETETGSETAETTPPATDAPSTDAPSTDTPVDEPDTPEQPEQPEIPEPAENSVFLTHSSPLRAGEEVTFIFSCSGEDVLALQGSIAYDSDLLTYIGASTLDSDWLFRISDNGDGTLIYVGLPAGAEGVSGVSQLFSLTFTLSADAETGAALPFKIADATALKGNDELTFDGGSVTFLVDRPISNDATLTELSAEAGSLSPEFDPTVTEYSLQVPYDCSMLELAATPASYATVEIGDSALEVGENIVTVTVTAESGSQQIYTLKVTRASDPNYVPSSNSLLAGLVLSDGMLFPAFSPSITAYTVYMVNEGVITLTPAPAELGSAEATTLDSTDGATCTITSVAEDGSNTVYTFKLLRVQTPDELAGSSGAQSGGLFGNIGNSGNSTGGQSIHAELFIALLAVVAVSLFFVGFGVSQLVNRKKKKSIASSDADENATDTLTEASEESDKDE